MGDLLTRLQRAVGDAYRIEKELGGGGMSRLFLATEASLHRPVVIKLVTYEQVVSTPWFGGTLDYNFYNYNLAPAYRRLGEPYEARGDRAKAHDYYGRFVDLWKDADPELQPIVADPRAALKRLRGEPR